MDKNLTDKIAKFKHDYATQYIDQEQEDFLVLDRVNGIVKDILEDPEVELDYLFTEDKIKKRNGFWSKVKKALPVITQSALLIAITSFLVKEAVSFYSNGEPTLYSYYKAILTEVCFIFLASYQARSLLEKIVAPILRASLFLLMSFVISSQVILDSTKFSTSSTVVDNRVELIKKQIEDKQKTIDFYIGKGWAVSTNKHVKDKEKLQAKLDEVLSEQRSGLTGDVARVNTYKAYGNIAFRVIILMISMLISRRLFRWKQTA